MQKKVIVGIMVTMLLVSMAFNVVPTVAFTEPPIKLGVLGPMYWMQGQGIQEGATLAAEEINAAGGIAGHEVVLYTATTHPDAGVEPTPATGEAAMAQLMADDVDFAVGCFRSEAAFGAREVAMDNRIIYTIAGAGTDQLVDHPDVATFPDTVRGNYERYKYVFRVMPLNSSMLGRSVIGFLAEVIATKLIPIYGPFLKLAVVAEDTVWTDILYGYLSDPNFWNYYVFAGTPLEGIAIHPDVYKTRVSPVDPTWVNATVAAIEAAGSQLIIPLISSRVVSRPFVMEWGTVKPEAAFVGIDVPGLQILLHWNATGGLCEYETILATTGTRTPITSLSIQFWDAYVARWGHNPIHTAYGAYEALYTLAEAVEAWVATYGDFGPGKLHNDPDYDKLIPIIEQTDRISTVGQFKFTGPNPGDNGDYDRDTPDIQPYPYLAENPAMKGTLHDVFCVSTGATWPDGYSRPFWGQWQAGRLEVIWPADQPYSENFALPPWMLNTPVGSDVTVTDPITDITTTFSETTSTGTTTVNVTDTGPTPPSGFSLAGLYYDITTTASYTGPIEIAIEYDETLVENEENLKLLHWDPVGEVWEDVTTGLDTTNNIIYGQVTSLSLFAVMEPSLKIPATVDIDPDTLNLKSNGEFITAYIELPNGYDVANIDLSTVCVDDIPAITDPQYGFVTDPNSYLMDHDGDGILERMVKFDRALVRELLTGIVDYEEGTKFYDLLLTVTGEVAGTPFEGSDTITVIYKGS